MRYLFLIILLTAFACSNQPEITDSVKKEEPKRINADTVIYNKPAEIAVYIHENGQPTRDVIQNVKLWADPLDKNKGSVETLLPFEEVKVIKSVRYWDLNLTYLLVESRDKTQGWCMANFVKGSW